VLCGDLVRAIRLEAAEAVAREWGVNPSTVSRWRRILGVKRFNPGTHHLFLKFQGKALTAETTARGRASQTPEKQIDWGLKRREEGRTRKRRWSAAENAMLGTMPDNELATRLGCSSPTIALRRRELRIAPFLNNPARAAAVRASTAGLLRYSPEKLRARRLALGLFQTQMSERCGWTTSAMYRRLESGIQDRATPEVLARVARALECPLPDLLRSDDNAS
jgi:transposase-like protein/DNA-binding Xre family transcriptional regulator